MEFFIYIFYYICTDFKKIKNIILIHINIKYILKNIHNYILNIYRKLTRRQNKTVP